MLVGVNVHLDVVRGDREELRATSSASHGVGLGSSSTRRTTRLEPLLGGAQGVFSSEDLSPPLSAANASGFIDKNSPSSRLGTPGETRCTFRHESRENGLITQ